MAMLVKDLLKRPYFKHAKVLAGRNGIAKEINWAHIIEIEHFGHLLNGQEVILTTGISWAEDEDKCLAYLQQLLDHNVSALCVELVIHVQQLPDKMLELAEKHDFPIIAFMEEVRFIDITKDLHEQILGKQENIWMELERFHQSLNQILTTNGTIGDLLKVLHQETGKEIVLQYYDQYRFFPSPSKKEQLRRIKEINSNTKSYYAHPVYVLNEQIGKIIFVEPLQSLTRFDELALKRCSEIMNQYFWRHHQTEEMEHQEKNKWILEMIEGELTEEHITQFLKDKKPNIVINDAIIGVKPIASSLISKDKEKSSNTRFIMTLRSALVQFGFELFTVDERSRMINILFIVNQQTSAMLPRLKKAIAILKEKQQKLLAEDDIELLSFGSVFTRLTSMPNSYRKALVTLGYLKSGNTLNDPFYTELGLYRIIDQMKNKKELSEIVQDYISPLIEHDQEKGTELVKTLKVYLKYLGQKNETAKELHIVRQTLYHRLHKIEQLLGEDYMEPENRFMIEFAIKVYDMNK